MRKTSVMVYSGLYSKHAILCTDKSIQNPVGIFTPHTKQIQSNGSAANKKTAALFSRTLNSIPDLKDKTADQVRGRTKWNSTRVPFRHTHEPKTVRLCTHQNPQIQISKLAMPIACFSQTGTQQDSFAVLSKTQTKTSTYTALNHYNSFEWYVG